MEDGVSRGHSSTHSLLSTSKTRGARVFPQLGFGYFLATVPQRSSSDWAFMGVPRWLAKLRTPTAEHFGLPSRELAQLKGGLDQPETASKLPRL